MIRFARHALAFLLAFSVEVTVHASEVYFQNVQGMVEIQKGEKSQILKPKSQIAAPFIVQTYKESQSKFKLEHMVFSLGKNTVLEVKGISQIRLYRGSVLIESLVKQPPVLKIESPQGITELQGSALVEANSSKTQVDVISGTALLTERIDGAKKVEVAQGFSSWIAGRNLEGHHEFGEAESSSWQEVVRKWSELSQTNQLAFRDKVYTYRPVWKKALESTTAKITQKIKADFKAFDDYVAEEERKAQAIAAEKASLRKMFRSKAFVEPDENTESPSESERFPANAQITDDTEHSDKSEQ